MNIKNTLCAISVLILLPSMLHGMHGNIKSLILAHKAQRSKALPFCSKSEKSKIVAQVTPVVTSDKLMQETSSIRSMNIDELKHIAFQWAANEDWNPGKYDYESYYDANKEGFLMLSINNIDIGCMGFVSYPPSFAFIGLLILKPEYRELGYGRKIWDYVIDKISHHQTIAGCAVSQQLKNYEKWSQFKKIYTIRHFEGIKNLKLLKNIPYIPEIVFVQPSNIELIEKIMHYDEKNLGINRRIFLEGLIKQTGVSTAVMLNNKNEVSAYGTIRPCQTGYRIGSLYADDIKNAELIAQNLLLTIDAESKIIMDIPSINPYSEAFAKLFDLHHIASSDTHMIIRGTIPEKFIQGNQKSYGLASLELS